MSELSPVWGTIELTPTEAAAMRTDLHATTCPIPLGECVECMSKLRDYRKVIAAVEPVIAEEKAKDPTHECMYSKVYLEAQTALDELLGPNEEDGCGGGLVAEIWHIAHRCEHFENDSDGPPVAASSTDESLEGVEASDVQ